MTSAHLTKGTIMFTNSPLYKLCSQAADLSDRSDWQAVRIDPIAGTVATVDGLTEEVIYLDPDTQRLDYSVNGNDAHLYSHLLRDPAHILTSWLLWDELFHNGDLSEPVTFQPVVVDVYDCDECPTDDDGDGCPSDHNAGWALIIKRDK